MGDNNPQAPRLEVEEEAYAQHMDMSDAAESPEDRDASVNTMLNQLRDREADPLVIELLETLRKENKRLRERVDVLEENQETTHDIATTAVAKAETNKSRVDTLETEEDETREIAKSAVAKASQVEADISSDQQEKIEDLPQGVEPSTSPLDFFANCRAQKLRKTFVEQGNKTNTYRAICVAKRWPEFGRQTTAKGGQDIVSFNRDDLKDALTAHLGERPHRQTVTRVWRRLRDDLGGDDIEEGERNDASGTTKVLRMDLETAEGLLDSRYRSSRYIIT